MKLKIHISDVLEGEGSRVLTLQQGIKIRLQDTEFTLREARLMDDILNAPIKTEDPDNDVESLASIFNSFYVNLSTEGYDKAVGCLIQHFGCGLRVAEALATVLRRPE